MKRFVLAAACVLYPCLLACAEPVEVSVNKGGLCVLESKATSAYWVVSPTVQKFEVVSKSGNAACMIDVSDERQRYVIAVHPFAAGDEPQAEEWLVTVGQSPPTPGPDVDPDEPDKPDEPDDPPLPPPDTFTAWITKTVRERVASPVDAPQVAQAFAGVAAACGVSLFTGPDIRKTTDEKLDTIPGWPQWSGFDEALDASNGEWSRAEYRDFGEYKERWQQIAEGVAAAAVTREVEPKVTLWQGLDLPIGREIEYLPRSHRIRNGRLLQYTCRPGERCRWEDVGSVMMRSERDGKSWVVLGP